MNENNKEVNSIEELLKPKSKPMKQWTFQDLPTFKEVAQKSKRNPLESILFIYADIDREFLLDLLNYAQTHSPEEK